MKRENLTFLEAVKAMERGEFCESGGSDLSYRIYDNRLEFWNARNDAWALSRNMYQHDGPWRIVPDPSKPKKKASEEAWERMVEAWKVWKGDIYAVDMDEHARDFYRAIIDCAKAEMREEMEGK